LADIGSIPGIKTGELRAFAEANLSTTDDLLRIECSNLVRHFPAISLKRAVAWQSLAELLQLDGLDIEQATALQAEGANGLSEINAWPLARWKTALPRTNNEILLNWIKDAVRLTHTGVLNGNVRLKDGTPVESAEVTVAGITATTDVNGRFRVTRLALDRKVTVTVHHPTLGYRLTKGVPVSRATALIGQTFTLAGRKQSPKRLSVLTGDTLPPIGSAPIVVVSTPGLPDTADILRLINRYSNGDARAASQFFDFDGGRFVCRTYRIKVADLPAKAKDGDHLEWAGKKWVLKHYTAYDIERATRLRKLLGKQKKGPLSVAEAEAAMRAAAKAFLDKPR
jgi:hypothetical protein